MKKQIFACVLFSLAFLLSCSDENLPSGNFEPLAKAQSTNNRIDMQEATNLAEEAIVFLNREHPSESKSSRTVNSVSILRFGSLKSSMMKSGEYSEALDISDTLAYVFNFEDSLGFVIISKDKRIESPLLAFTQKGSLVNGETDNPGLKLFLERLEGYMLESIAKYGKDDQKSMAVAQKGPYTGPLDTVVKPFIPVEWGQGEPFNNNLANKGCYGYGTAGNGKVWAGCVATAVAQTMAHWEYPASLGGGTYNWTILRKYKRDTYFSSSSSEATLARNSVADLFQRIGAGVGMDYSNGCVGSGVHDMDDVLYFLEINGFSNPDMVPYPNSSSTAFAMIKLGLKFKIPYIAIGFNNGNYSEGHAWIIDGLAKNSNSSSFIHNNWGWDGSGDGYYASGVFDPSPFNFQKVEITKVFR